MIAYIHISFYLGFCWRIGPQWKSSWDLGVGLLTTDGRNDGRCPDGSETFDLLLKSQNPEAP